MRLCSLPAKPTSRNRRVAPLFSRTLSRNIYIAPPAVRSRGEFASGTCAIHVCGEGARHASNPR